VAIVTPTKVCQEAAHSAQVLAVAAGMNIHVYTSIYISRNEVEHRLGKRTAVLVVGITLTYSQNVIEYTYVHPHPSQAPRLLIPMSQTPVLIETSFADAIMIIAASGELPKQTQRHWATSLRQIAKALDKPLEVIPARLSAVRADLARLHHAPAGLTPKTLRNHKSSVRSALRWLAREKGIPQHGAPLTAAWADLQAQISNRFVRWRLSSFMRFCSANGIEPAEVGEIIVERFKRYRAQSGMATDDASGHRLVRAWNSNVGNIQGWPARQLREPAVKPTTELPWAQFPEGFRRDVDQYLQGLTKMRKSRNGRRIRPLKPTTIRQRRVELAAAARMAVKTSVPIGDLNSLSALLSPDVAEKILDAYWAKNGETPKAFTIDLAYKFATIARETKCVDDAACERLDEMRRHLEDQRRGGLTEKNTALIRQVLTLGVWDRVVKLPQDLMSTARSQRSCALHRAALTAQIAVAIAILTVAPVRLGNLIAIRLGINLIKPGGPGSNYWLVFSDYDVKNRVRLQFPLAEYITRLIDEYVHDFRPVLLRGRTDDWLFPGQRGGAKSSILFSGQITQRIYQATGLRMTVHQFRHAAGALILQCRPGEYELVRQLLGHRNVQTTISAYIGLDNIHASEIFSKIVMQHLDDDLEAAE
jgi:Phage integrase family